MLTKRERHLSQTMVVAQVILTVVVFLALSNVYSHRSFTLPEIVFYVFQIVLIWGFFMHKLRLGVVFRANTFLSGLRGYLVTVVFGSLLFYNEIKFIPYIPDRGHSLKFIIFFALTDLVLLVVFKTGLYYTMLFLRQKGHNTRQLLIIADQSSIPFIDSFIGANDWGYRILGILSPYDGFKDTYKKVPIIHQPENLPAFLLENAVDDIFYCLPMDDKHYDLEKLLNVTGEVGVNIHILQQEYLQSLSVYGFKKLKKDGFVTHSTVPDNYVAVKMKDLFDIIFSAAVLAVLSPLILFIAFLIKIGDGGPVFFKQERIGLNGRRFMVFKFRTMVVNAEEMKDSLSAQNEADGPVFKIAKDPRITKLGHILRKTSLDELPQFYNVMKGEMSVVGPRPPLLKEVLQYQRPQLRRLSMKPGITGSWQVWGRHRVTFDEWMKMDLDYIDHWSMWLDLKIMLSTIWVIVGAKGS